MSNLGIRNVLPYSGTNGITVNGSVISIDPNGTIQTGTINLSPVTIGSDQITQLDGNGIRVLKGTYNLLSNLDYTGLQVNDLVNNNYVQITNNFVKTYQFQDMGGGDSLVRGVLIDLNKVEIKSSFNYDQYFDYVQLLSNEINVYVGYTANKGNVFLLDNLGNVQMSTIQTTKVSGNLAPIIIFDSVNNVITVPNSTLNIVVSGVPARIGIQQ